MCKERRLNEKGSERNILTVQVSKMSWQWRKRNRYRGERSTRRVWWHRK